ncbi:Vacuolar protein-sorting-associated protein 33 [Actinomortierella wolfii]|nr:Vacuolar protein-sorting-associated protein 33 [Actinomortierella wolfii]
MSSSTAATAAAAAAAAPVQQAGAHLGHTLLSIDSLRDLARKELVNLLDSVQGKKGLILDPNLSGPLSLIAEISLLKDHGVEKVYHLQPGPLETECKNLIYICRPQVNYMRYIAGMLWALCYESS